MPVVTSVATFNVRNATCVPTCIACNGVSEFGLSPGSDGLGLAQMVQFTGAKTYNTGSTQSTTTGAWSSSSQSVATVNSSGATTALALGQSNIELVIEDVPVAASSICAEGGNNPSCPMAFQMGGSAPVSVGRQVTILSSNCFQTNNGTQVPYYASYGILGSISCSPNTDQVDSFTVGTGTCTAQSSSAGTINCLQANSKNSDGSICTRNICANTFRSLILVVQRLSMEQGQASLRISLRQQSIVTKELI